MSEPMHGEAALRVVALRGSAVSLRDLRVRQVGLLAEENLLGVAVNTARAVCLAARRGHLAGFEQLLEAANVLAHDELRVLAEERGETARKRTARERRTARWR